MPATSAPTRPLRAALIVTLAVSLAACSTGVVSSPAAKAPPAARLPHDTPIYDTDEEKVLSIYNWKDYIDPRVLDLFTLQTGIEVKYEILESNDLLEAKLCTGHTGYDVVFPSGTFLRRQIELGLYRKLDKSTLANLGNLDSNIARKLALFDPGNAHAVNYMFGTSGITYNVEAVAAVMPDAPLDSLAMIWDPKVVSKFADCGVAMLDEPSEVVGTVLIYLGKDANSEKAEDLAAAEKVMMAVRPYIRMFSSDYVDELVSGEICLGLNWSGDTLYARGRALSERKPFDIGYRLPREGALMFLDTMAIPADARHVKNAHLFIDYLLRADMAARNSNFTGFANGNGSSSWLLIDHDVVNDQNFFPPAEMQEKLVPDLPESAEFTRQLSRTWARFRAGDKIEHR